MTEAGVHISVDEAVRFMTDVFVGLGVPPADAAVCADVLAEADRRGIDSHGLNRLKPIYYDRLRQGILNPVTRIDVVREGPTTAVVDGGHGMGHVVGRRSMDMAIAKARRYGLGMVAVRNSTHFGIAGYYASMAVDAGMIGMIGTNARPSVAPTFGVENMLGTNALSFGIPSDEPFPFLLDCATSLSQRGKVEYCERLGLPMPPGWVIDESGRTQTDAARALRDLSAGRAALTPLGGIGEDGAGYKGYGYATVVEILSSALQAGAFMKALSGVADGRPAPMPVGHFFVAMDVAAFEDPNAFRRRVGDVLRALRASRKAPGQERIYTAGEKEYLAWQERRRTGIPLPAAVQREMIAMRDELGLSARYPFPGFAT